MTNDQNPYSKPYSSPYADPSSGHVPCIRPRRQIGPDAVMMLRHVSKYNTGDKFAYDDCRVQRHTNGTPTSHLEFDSMEPVGKGHPESYGYLLKRHLIPKAKATAAHLRRMDDSLREWELSVLLKKAQDEHDGFAHWLLSVAPIRSLLFPDAYVSNRRVDRVLYIDKPNDKRNRGQVADLGSLKPSDITRFTAYVKSLINEEFDPITITPLQSKSLFLRGNHPND